MVAAAPFVDGDSPEERSVFERSFATAFEATLPPPLPLPLARGTEECGDEGAAAATTECAASCRTADVEAPPPPPSTVVIITAAEAAVTSLIDPRCPSSSSPSPSSPDPIISIAISTRLLAVWPKRCGASALSLGGRRGEAESAVEEATVEERRWLWL